MYTKSRRELRASSPHTACVHEQNGSIATCPSTAQWRCNLAVGSARHQLNAKIRDAVSHFNCSTLFWLLLIVDDDQKSTDQASGPGHPAALQSPTHVSVQAQSHLLSSSAPCPERCDCYRIRKIKPNYSYRGGGRQLLTEITEAVKSMKLCEVLGHSHPQATRHTHPTRSARRNS